GGPRRGYVFCRDAGFAVRASARQHHGQEDDLRRIRQVIQPGARSMLRKPDGNDQTTTTPVRIAALDRARTCITLLVVLHHSVVNYTYFGNGDHSRWLGFDLVVLFNDSFFMACMFFIAGLFVRDSLVRRGPAGYLGNRAWRLGIPFLLSIFVLMPVAYYPTFLRYHL